MSMKDKKVSQINPGGKAEFLTKGNAKYQIFPSKAQLTEWQNNIHKSRGQKDCIQNSNWVLSQESFVFDNFAYAWIQEWPYLNNLL